MFAAPSGAAADMALDVLFPSLPLLSAQSPVPVAFPVSAAATEDKAKPFALSNLAFSAVQDATPTKPTTRQLSPSIEKALAELEQREEHERLRKASRSSLGSATSPATLRNASPMSAKDAPGPTPPIQGERRVFTARTPEPSDDEAEEVEEVLNLHAEQVPDPPRAVAAPQAGEAAEEAAPAPSSSIVSATATPSLSRTASVASVASLGSSGASFRARPAPSARPTIEPRMTKAAALRLGISLPPSTPRRSVASTSNASAVATPAQAPARRTSVVATPRSLAKPSITPRMTKAASLRTKAEPAELEVGRKGPRAPPQPQVTAKKRQSISTAERAAMDRLARRHSVATAPAAGPAPAPQVQVRMSRTALLRQGVTPAPPACAAPSPAPALASMPLVRRKSVPTGLKALREPARPPQTTRAASLRAGPPAGRPSLSRAASSCSSSMPASSTRPRSASAASSAELSATAAGLAAPLGRRTSRAAPVIAPRLNKAAELRRSKLAAEAATSNNKGAKAL